MMLAPQTPVELLLAAVVMLSSGQHSLVAGDAVVATTLCAVVENPAHFDGKRVRFVAELESDGMENSVLTSPHCKSGIIPYDAEVHQNASELAALDAALERGMAGTLDKSVKATFVGVFEYRRQKARTQRILHIERVIGLTVLPKTTAYVPGLKYGNVR